MRKGQASRTAGTMALIRALESARPRGRRLFDDPFARAFLGPHLRLLTGLARLPGVADGLGRVLDRRWPGARSSGVARTWLIDDRVRAALDGGAGQIVLLGAGFDARAYRLPIPPGVVAFEVDHPDTQAAKRRAVGSRLGAAPPHVRFVAVDFDRDPLAARMAASGFEPSRRAIVVWEGVSNYLAAPSVDATLRWCAGAAPGSEVVFTYVDRAVLDDPGSFEGTARLFADLGDAGERWTFGFDPRDLAGHLDGLGLRLVEDLGAADYRRLAFGPAAVAMRGYEFYRIARAVVPGPSRPIH